MLIFIESGGCGAVGLVWSGGGVVWCVLRLLQYRISNIAISTREDLAFTLHSMIREGNTNFMGIACVQYRFQDNLVAWIHSIRYQRYNISDNKV